jgi:phosphoglycerate kinase
MGGIMGWKTLDDMDLAGKRVLTRVDINVPMQDGQVTDATRIEKIAPTVRDILGRRRHTDPIGPFRTAPRANAWMG